jgi:hypothetical protein
MYNFRSSSEPPFHAGLHAIATQECSFKSAPARECIVQQQIEAHLLDLTGQDHIPAHTECLCITSHRIARDKARNDHVSSKRNTTSVKSTGNVEI